MLSMKTKQYLPSLAFKVFDMLSFIKDHKIPFFSTEYLLVQESDFVASYADLEAIHFAPSVSFGFPFFGGSKVGHDLESWAPSFELYFPVNEYASWNYNKVRSPDSFFCC